MCAGHGINLVGESPITGIHAKCSESQVVSSNAMDEGRDVAKSMSLRTET